MPTQTFWLTNPLKDATVSRSVGGSTYPPATASFYDYWENLLYVSRSYSGGNTWLEVGIMEFDTSPLPDNATITGGNLVFFAQGGIVSVDARSLVAEWYTPAHAVSDYTATPAATAHTGTPLLSLVANADNTVALTDSAGFPGISKTGKTGLRLHVTQLTSNVIPTGDNYIGILSVEGDPLLAPRLVINYTVPDPPPPGGDAITDTFTLTDTTKDGYVSAVGSSYASLGAPQYDGTDTSVYVGRDLFGASFQVFNGIVAFDTSAIPDDATITGASVTANAWGKSDANSLSLVMEWYTPTFSASDYTITPSTTAHTGTPLSSIPATDSGYSYTLTDSTGFPNISKSALTGLRLHLTQLASNAAPTGRNYVGFYSANNNTPLKNFRLSVTYTTPESILEDYDPTAYVDAVTAITAARLNNEEVQVDVLTDAVLEIQASGGLTVADTLADLRNIDVTDLEAGVTRYVRGHSSVGDPGAGFFRWHPEIPEVHATFDATDVVTTDTPHGFYDGMPIRLRVSGTESFPKINSVNFSMYRTYYVWYNRTGNINSTSDFYILAGPTDTGALNIFPGGYALVRPLDTKLDPDDNGILIRPNANPQSGRWERVYDGNEINALWFGAKRDGGTFDTQALNNALRAHQREATPLLIPGGEYYVNDTLYSIGQEHAIRGGGGMRTGLKFASNAYDGLVLLGSQVPYTSNGYLQDIAVYQENVGLTDNYMAGIKLYRVQLVSVERCLSSGWNFAYDLVNNCGGSALKECRSPFSGSIVGLYLRTGTQSGADITFHNNWLHGRDAAVWMEGNNGGLHFYGGQLSAGHSHTSAQDTLGVIVVGKQYENQASLGGVYNIELNGVSFEGPHRCWMIRVFDEIALTCVGTSFFSSSTPHPIGVLKSSSNKTYSVTFDSCMIQGRFTATQPIQISSINAPGTFMVWEQNTRGGPGGAQPIFGSAETTQTGGATAQVRTGGMVGVAGAGTVGGAWYMGGNGLLDLR